MLADSGRRQCGAPGVGKFGCRCRAVYMHTKRKPQALTGTQRCFCIGTGRSVVLSYSAPMAYQASGCRRWLRISAQIATRTQIATFTLYTCFGHALSLLCGGGGAVAALVRARAFLPGRVFESETSVHFERFVATAWPPDEDNIRMCCA